MPINGNKASTDALGRKFEIPTPLNLSETLRACITSTIGPIQPSANTHAAISFGLPPPRIYTL